PNLVGRVTASIFCAKASAPIEAGAIEGCQCCRPQRAQFAQAGIQALIRGAAEEAKDPGVVTGPPSGASAIRLGAARSVLPLGFSGISSSSRIASGAL